MKTKVQQVREIFEADPKADPKTVAKKVKCHPTQVYHVRKAMQKKTKNKAPNPSKTVDVAWSEVLAVKEIIDKVGVQKAASILRTLEKLGLR